MKHSYHAHHAAIGAGGSFLVGLNGAPGGFVRGASYAGSQDVFVGYRYAGEPWTLLPFVREATAGASGGAISLLPHGRYGRMFGWASDRWMAQALVFLLTTPFAVDPSPEASSPGGTPSTWTPTPAIFGHLDYDNSHMSVPVELIFAIGGGTWRALSPGDRIAGVWSEVDRCGFASLSAAEVAVVDGRDLLGVPAEGLHFRIPAGGKAVFPLVWGWGAEGGATLAATMAQRDAARVQAQRCDDALRASGLPEEGRRQVSLRTRERIAGSTEGVVVDLSLASIRAELGV